jgi:hypothetical protein
MAGPSCRREERLRSPLAAPSRPVVGLRRRSLACAAPTPSATLPTLLAVDHCGWDRAAGELEAVERHEVRVAYGSRRALECAVHDGSSEKLSWVAVAMVGRGATTKARRAARRRPVADGGD